MLSKTCLGWWLWWCLWQSVGKTGYWQYYSGHTKIGNKRVEDLYLILVNKSYKKIRLKYFAKFLAKYGDIALYDEGVKKRYTIDH